MRYPPVSPCRALANVLPLDYLTPDVAPRGAGTGRHGETYAGGFSEPARETTGRHRVLRRDDVVALSLLDPEGMIGLSAPDQHTSKPGPGVRACNSDRAGH